MELNFRRYSILIIVLNLPFFLLAQSIMPEKEMGFNAEESFAPNFYSTNGNSFRSAAGAPGPHYWQNSSNYTLKASLNPIDSTISGNETIQYINHSPDNLSYLWIQLDQNIFRPDSRIMKIAAYQGSRFSQFRYTDGFEIESVEIQSGKFQYGVLPQIYETRMRLNLKESLKGRGGELFIKIKYKFKVNGNTGIRTGILNTPYGNIWGIAQWYPRMAVYDDILGWNTLPYMGSGEFYLDYGNFNLYLEAPSNYIVACSGELLNPESVLSSLQLKRLKRALSSDSTVIIHSSQEVLNESSMKVDDKKKTWHFQILNSRDASWACSKAFVWDAARIVLPSKKSCLAQSFYPIESGGDSSWGRSTEYVKNCLELNSRKWFEFPYPTASNIAMNIGGMEYPGMVFCSYNSKRGSLWSIINHEFCHTWFPIIVGSDERRYMWMDEGFNTFMNRYSSLEFHKGEYKIGIPNGSKLAGLFFAPESESIWTRPDIVQEYNISNTFNLKPGTALRLLRDYVLGAERFDKAFKIYIERWAFKHPVPDDFFRTIENASGEDLSWFWRGWFLNNWTFDQGIRSVKYPDQNPLHGAWIELENNGKVVMPTFLKIYENRMPPKRIELPVEIWQRGSPFVYHYSSTRTIDSVILDPDRVYPDIYPQNNIYPKR